MRTKLTPPEAPGAKWNIYRFELVLFNALQNRWQLFQERSHKDEKSFYRREIQALLRSVRQATALHCRRPVGGSKRPSSTRLFGCADANAYSAATGLCRLNLTHLVEFFDNFRIPHQQRRSMVEKVEETLRDDKIFGPAVRNILQAMKNGRNVNRSVSRGVCLDLLSALPLKRDWDVYGRIQFPRPAGKSRSSDRGDLGLAARRLFAYKITLEEPRADGKFATRAERALGYNVFLDFPQAECALARTSRSFSGRYYNLVGDVSNELAGWYGFYGHMVDALQVALADPVPDDQTVPRDIYVISYPLRICGWDHFLQLYVRPVSNGRAYAAAELEADWGSTGGIAGSAYDTAVFKECLRELLVQIRIAAFQRFVRDSLYAQQHAFVADKYFAAFAPILVRASCLDLRGKYYAYPKRAGDPIPRWAHDRDPGVKFPTKDDAHVAEIANGVRVLVPWEADRFRESLNPLFRETGRQRLAEQWEWVAKSVKMQKKLVELRRLADM
jgi:hypothetical protein